MTYKQLTDFFESTKGLNVIVEHHRSDTLRIVSYNQRITLRIDFDTHTNDVDSKVVVTVVGLTPEYLNSDIRFLQLPDLIKKLSESKINNY